MKFRVSIFMFTIISGCIFLFGGVNALSAQKQNDLQTLFTKHAEFIQNNTLMDDESKIKKLQELFIQGKIEDYKMNDDLDLSTFTSKTDKNKKDIDFVNKKLKELKKLRKENESQILWDNVSLDFKKVEITGDSAIVVFIENYKYVLDDFNYGISESALTYNVEWQRINNKWLITKITSNDIYDRSFKDSGMPALSINSNAKKAPNAGRSVSNYLNIDKTAPAVKTAITPQWSEEPYNGTSAMIYALTYATNNNSKFPYYSGSAGTNCQNFGSQCVWYGLGGGNDQDSINNKLFPMISGSTNRDWYHTGQLWGTPSANNFMPWIRVNDFATYVSNGGYQKLGPKGQLVTGGGLSNVVVGDIIQLDEHKDGVFDHTVVVVAVSGAGGLRTEDDIWFSDHPGGFNNVKLSTIYPSTAFGQRYIRITGANKQ